METQALINLLTEARAGLFPFIAKRIDENGDEYETDFCTEVFCFHSNLLSVFQELEKNAINNSIIFNSEVAGNYGIQATKILSQVRDQLRNFFHEDNEYQTQVRQIESENITEEPFLESATAVSISEKIMEYPVKEVAIYANRVCQWGVLLLQRYTTEQGVSGSTYPVATSDYDIPAKTVQVLLMYYTGIFGHLVTMYKSNYTKVSEAMAAIVGGNPRTINRVFNFISNKNSQHRNNPYTNKEIVETLIEKLSLLEIDTKELENILFKLK